MAHTSRNYLPAAGHDWALPFYDAIVRLMGGMQAIQLLLEQASLEPGQRILDVGCGTGTLAITIKRMNPQAEVIGLDPDPKALSRARRKAEGVGVSVQFDQGFGDRLPYPEASFDRVFSSFMLHHLPTEEKGRTLSAVRRVLRSGGSLHLVDFEGPEDGKSTFLARLFHTNERLRDNSEGRVLAFMRDAGFVNPKKTGRRTLLLGPIAYYRAGV
jgi:ubiquinone/menaquinone biosynthesis C-methylase UbiE